MVGVSGASGAAYSLRLLELLVGQGAEVHLVVTTHGRRLLAEEAGVRGLSPADLLPPALAVPLTRSEVSGSRAPPEVVGRLIIHPNQDVGAAIASGSFLHDGMVILPCSSASLGAVATGAGSNLLTRAAAVALKERRPLILCHRETPLALIDIENYRALTLAGAIICPTTPGLYLKPKRIEDLVDFIVGKTLDLLAVEHTLATRWEG